MTLLLPTAKQIFLDAIERHTPEQWPSYLDLACKGQEELRRRVEILLEAHTAQYSLLDVPAVAQSSTAASTVSEQPGNSIGPYKLLEQIGEGGFGVVFSAEQERPVRRKVALKVIKPGMDTLQVIARFEAERQALALMEHPNIARVLDAGTTENGRPYFVMELVQGVPITDYCDQCSLTTRARLELFITVCQAVQHAHQKGVIHRDIKPTNVLIAMQDGQPAPKIIDFGVAKALNQRLTEHTLATGYAQMIGTPLYMSPEQAELNPLGADTRSDIYSLGVLLYELLTGTTPFAKDRLQAASYDEIRRILREEDPPRPSARISTQAADLATTIADHRRTERRRLLQTIRGELDWVVMKCLEKDRNRRYESASTLASDIERYINNVPVQACPPSARYRFRKFARRNRTVMVTGTLALFFLTVLSGVVGWAVRDRSARQTRLSGQLELILDDVARLERDEKWVDALASARRAESALATGEAAPDIKNRMLQALADLEFVDRLEGIRAQSGTVWGQPDRSLIPVAVRADQNYATAFREEGIDVDTLPTIVAAQRITARTAIALALLPALDDWVAVRSKAKGEHATRRLVEVLKVADPDPWRQQVRDCLARKDWPTLESLARSPDLDRQPAATLSFLCAALRVNGKFLLEIEVVRRAQWKYPADFWFNHRLGLSLIWLQWPDHVREGIGYMHAAVAIRPNSAHAIMNLGNGYAFLKEHDKAIACFQKAIELCPKYWICWGNLGISLGRKGLHDEAISALETSIRLKPDLATEAYAELSIIHSCRPEVDRRSPRDATEFAEKAVELEPQASNHWTVLGIARYREHQWEEARSALHKSQQLAAHSSYGVRWHEAINWFFLAMSHWQLGQHNIAREHYDRAIQGMDKWPMAQTDDHLLLRVRTEAEEMLNIATTKTNPN